MVRKAGDIIPQVFDVLVNLRNGKEKKISEIKNCPVCGTGLEKSPSPLERDLGRGFGVKLICQNENCEAKVVNKIIYFASRKVANCLDINNIGSTKNP